VQINTGAGCHLDASMLARALHTLDPQPSSVVFIENVGNLVCPALFDLGESARVVVMSVTEGADKPLKYPHMFRTADVLLLNKTDLLPYVEFDVNRFREHVDKVNGRARVIEVSATRGHGARDWYGWLLERVQPAP
jgi:hydrogenase nickel incorporation protein HypB